MKKNLSQLLFVSAIIFSLGGCGNEEIPQSEVTQTLFSESQLSLDSTTRVHEAHTVMLYLEHPKAQTYDNDLHGTGNDCYTLTPTKSLEDIYLVLDENSTVGRLSIKNLQSGDFMDTSREEFNQTFSFEKDNNYEICVYHHGLSEDNQTIFLQFETQKEFTEASLLRFAKENETHLTINNECKGCDLSYFNFTQNHKDLSRCNLTDANLTGAIMNRNAVILDKAILNGAILDGISFQPKSMLGTKMNYIDASKAATFKLPDDIRDTSFRNSNLGSFERNSQSVLENVDFTNANLSGAILKDITFKNIDFTYANLSGAKLLYSNFTDRVTLRGTNFKDADLSGANFNNANLLWCTFEGVVADETTSFRYANLKEISKEQLQHIAKKDFNADFTGATQNIIRWSYNGKISAMECVSWYESEDSFWYSTDSKYWKDNYLCSAGNHDFHFKSNGQKSAYNNLNLSEGSDRSWGDNYWAYPTNSEFNFYWQSWGQKERKLCVNTKEDSDDSNTWGDNYICFDFK